MAKKFIPLSRPWFTKAEPTAAYNVVKSEWLIAGPKVEEFEKQFAKIVGAKYAVAVDTGSSAILVALAALGIKKGDEVIAPNMTFVSSASSCIYLGARPVLVDINLTDYCIDPAKIEKKITKKTKVIIPVHYAGQTAGMDEIMKIAKKYNLKVLEDAAESHLSEYNGRKSGTIGDIGIFSFTPSKPMTTGEGGTIVTNNSYLAEKARLIKNFSDTGKFEWDFLGFNFRMPEMMGAIGLEQLKKLKKAIELRRKIAYAYTQAFKNNESIITPFIRSPEDHNFQLYTIRFNLNRLKISRDKIIELLAKRGISSRLYYPCLHRQKVFSFLNLNNNEFTNSIEFEKSALSLPIYPTLTKKEIVYITENILDITQKNAR